MCEMYEMSEMSVIVCTYYLEAPTASHNVSGLTPPAFQTSLQFGIHESRVSSGLLSHQAVGYLPAPFHSKEAPLRSARTCKWLIVGCTMVASESGAAPGGRAKTGDYDRGRWH